MREIKFRGKRIDNGEWVEGGYCEASDKSLIVLKGADLVNPTGGICIDPYPVYYLRGWVEVHPETVGQSTGLKDKDFWGGDIVQSLDGLRKYIVTYREESAKWYLYGIGEAWCVYEVVWATYTKIGTIHDKEAPC